MCDKSMQKAETAFDFILYCGEQKYFLQTSVEKITP